MSMKGFVSFAATYYQAAETMSVAGNKYSNILHFSGPVMQMTGITTELALKSLLRGSGKDEPTLKKYSHNTYQAYYDARHLFSELDFVEQVFANTQHLVVPDEVREKIGEDAERQWRIFFTICEFSIQHMPTHTQPYPKVNIEPNITLFALPPGRPMKPNFQTP